MRFHRNFVRLNSYAFRLRELSFLMLDTGMEKFLEGYQIFSLALLGYQTF